MYITHTHVWEWVHMPIYMCTSELTVTATAGRTIGPITPQEWEPASWPPGGSWWTETGKWRKSRRCNTSPSEDTYDSSKETSNDKPDDCYHSIKDNINDEISNSFNHTYYTKIYYNWRKGEKERRREREGEKEREIERGRERGRERESEGYYEYRKSGTGAWKKNI